MTFFTPLQFETKKTLSEVVEQFMKISESLGVRYYVYGLRRAPASTAAPPVITSQTTNGSSRQQTPQQQALELSASPLAPQVTPSASLPIPQSRGRELSGFSSTAATPRGRFCRVFNEFRTRRCFVFLVTVRDEKNRIDAYVYTDGRTQLHA